ncbi:MAG: FAD-dependent oxidoreductase [Planctomycetaceae bacterium]|nr:FAD-dependent oxidoreductase [Planctomycetaceae bacterium]
MPSPIPLEPPVTRATLSVSCRSMRSVCPKSVWRGRGKTRFALWYSVCPGFSAERLEDCPHIYTEDMNSTPSSQRTVAVIGAGISGLTCAQRLQKAGFAVTVFEKSRGTGGRMSTRRTDQGFQFDHGAQYFTVRDPRFQRFVEEWQQEGVVAGWNPEIGVLTKGEYEPKQEETLRYVAVPGMNQIGRHLARGLDIHFQTRVRPPVREAAHWLIYDDQDFLLEEFDVVISTAPAAQSAELLVASPNLSFAAQQVKMTGCWAVMLAFEESLGLPFEAAFVNDSPLSWVACNSSKPGREKNVETWVLHASPEWSEEHLERQPNEMLFQLTEAFWSATGLAAREPESLTAHRWRYAVPPEPLSERYLFDQELQIGACGDWCGGPRVEGAFVSGYELAERIIATVRTTSSDRQG